MASTKRTSTRLPSGDLFAAQRGMRPTQHLVAHIDGGARGNPGPAGYGVVIEDQDGHRIADLSEFLGIQTNNYAEYRGLLAALGYALEHDFTALQVVSDSELMVRQIKGIYKVKSPSLAKLYQQARALIRKLQWFEIGHVLRAGNREADRLANAAMDRGMNRGLT
jgi:ribonuclease HI